jgi:hypothetical protein
VWIKQALTRVLLNWLPVDEQERMAADVVAWLCADMPPLRWLDPREAPAEDPAKSQLNWLVCRWY